MRHLWLCAVMLALVTTPASASPPTRPGFDVNGKISPDGRWILFDRYFASGSRYAPPSHSLRIVDSDGRQERELVPETGGAVEAKWTPGNLIHVTRGSEAFLLDPENGANLGPAHPAAAFSPDGRWIAFVQGSRELWVSAPDGSNAHRVALAPSWVGAGAFSPDSLHLTYVVGLGVGEEASEIVGADGSGRARLKEAPVIAPGLWSPDSRFVVFTAQNDSRRYRPPNLYVANVDGSSVRRLVDGFATAPDWSPRGDWIAYERQVSTRREDRYYLMLVHPDGSGVRRVLRAGSGRWLSDGRRMLSSGSGACRRSGILEIDVFQRTVKRLTNRCRIEGTERSDMLRGTGLRDLVYGFAGDDTIEGRGGDDALFGGPGADRLLARDGRRDTVDCGPGRDLAVVDRRDVVRACERVTRR
jgi:Tol biopolymer transport system component